MLTVTQLANKYRISRATVLYYERAGLLKPTVRSDNGYRWYGKKEAERLESILAYRSYGVPVAQIQALLDREGSRAQEDILRDQFNHLEAEIRKLRQQQKAIVALLQQPDLMGKPSVTKQRWVEIMQAAGFDEEDMIQWHRQFEKMEPEEHQKFLESLGIDTDEIRRIRNF
ncbi:MerR family transcriptional regulator [Hahella sp. CCB-MM4]|uniref:MerR family transcriptional regulator n=1 Tax=Hahella sp. (strain CCB-MM4) TaxID=1926491 RepID=UPI000B9B5DD2|nr:MerR family transcriptional regulator [Hahella sp. CCB-MM4]OZG72998.1 MerR family transcriptional regulator [Hahella sp. CCB-MM4]